jgi:hypothetical protein
MDTTPPRRPNTWEEDVQIQYKFRRRIIQVSSLVFALSSVPYVWAALSLPRDDGRKAIFYSIYLTFCVLGACAQFIANRCPACDVYNPLSMQTYRSDSCKKCHVRLKAAKVSIADKYQVTPEQSQSN